MKTLKLTLAIAALTIVPVLGIAQEKPSHPEKGHHEKMTKELNLSQEQAEKVKEINLKNREGNKIIKAKMKPLKAEIKALHQERKKLRELKMKEIELVLTPEQFAKFKEMKHHHKGNHNGKKHHH